MKRRVIFIVLPIILVLAVLTSPALAKDPEQPEKGLLWEAIAGLQEGLTALAKQLNEGLESLQEQIDGIQAYLANFTEEDPVFSAMDTEADLETHIGDNVLTEGEDITLLNNDAGYVTQALQVANIKEVRKEEYVDAFVGKWERISFTYDLPAGAVPICANGEVWVSWFNFPFGWDEYRLDADDYRIYPSFATEEEVLFRCYYEVPLLYPLTDTVTFWFYYSYIEP
jgi:hypothetical protein